jgi:mediator of RNA polymerase II transcription subunit 13
MGLNSGTSQSSSSNGLSSNSSNAASSSINTSNLNLINSNYLTTQQHTQQCNVLYVAYCLSDDQRFLLTSCSDENGELIESTSISIEIDERFKRNKAHGRRIGLRKLWEFVMAIISQTCKPWRLVIGRLGRMGHSELRGWACLLSKKNLQRVCQQFKDSCDTCNILGNMEVPCILSASLISMEGSESICVYPEAFSREDKQAAAALTGQTLVSNHASQAHGVSCTHILTFPASAVSQLTSNIGVGLKDGTKSDPVVDDNDFFDFFKFEDEDMNEILNENINDKNLNESGANGVDGDQANSKEKIESILNQEEIAHLDQQPLAVGYYVSTARCGPLPKWLRGDVSLESNFHTFKVTISVFL